MWAGQDLFDLLSVGRGFGMESLKIEQREIFKEIVWLMTVLTYKNRHDLMVDVSSVGGLPFMISPASKKQVHILMSRFDYTNIPQENDNRKVVHVFGCF